MLDGAIVSFRDRLRAELTVEEIVALLTDTIRSRWQPSFVTVRLDHGEPQQGFLAEDPLVGYALRHCESIVLSTLNLESPLLTDMQNSGATLAVPLLMQGTLGGFIVIGTRPVQSDLTPDDLMIMEELAALGAAGLRIAWLTHQHEASSQAWENNSEELRLAQRIQGNLLPKDLPAFPGWAIGHHYQPARIVGGDLYDFIPLPGDLLGIVFGDASDKSVPAALTMATARTLLRASAQRLVLPAQVLARVNEILADQLPPGTFVTCFFAILDPATGRFRYANAGQTTPFLCRSTGVFELRASGWPLGMMPKVDYDEEEVTIGPGDIVVFYSDGLIETHAPDGEMFGGPHLLQTLAGLDSHAHLIKDLLTDHAAFAGPEWDQEDDLTIVTLAHLPQSLEIIADFSFPSVNGTEREAVARVEEALTEAGVSLPRRRLERLKTAVAETVMNAIEHGNENRPELSVHVQTRLGPAELRIHVTDQGSGVANLSLTRPSLATKITEDDDPRGWGIFLIQQMVDEVIRTTTADGYEVELVMHLTHSIDDSADETGSL